MNDSLGRPEPDVKDEEGMLSVNDGGRTEWTRRVHRILPPDVTPFSPLDVCARSPVDEDVLHRAVTGQRGIGCRLEWDCSSAAKASSWVITTEVEQSSIRSRRASAENPPNTTECTAPTRAHASMAIAASGTIPIYNDPVTGCDTSVFRQLAARQISLWF